MIITMKHYTLFLSGFLFFITVLGTAHADQPRTAGSMPLGEAPVNSQAENPFRQGFCGLKERLMRLRHNQGNDMFDQRAQWEGVDEWDPEVWAANGYTGRSAKRVLDNLFQGGYFLSQYQSCNVPYLQVGAPFFTLAEVDQLRALDLIADYTNVLETNRAFKVYSVPDRRVIGSYSMAGFHLY